MITCSTSSSVGEKYNELNNSSFEIIGIVCFFLVKLNWLAIYHIFSFYVYHIELFI